MRDRFDSTGIPGGDDIPGGEIEIIKYSPDFDSYTDKDVRFAIMNMIMSNLRGKIDLERDDHWEILIERVREVEDFLDEVNEEENDNDKGKGAV